MALVKNEIIRFKDLQKGDEFLFLNIPYKVVKTSKTQVFYLSVNQHGGRENTMGRNCMMLVTLVKRV